MDFPFIGCIEHFLTESHEQECVRISMELLRFLEESSRQKLGNVFTDDASGFVWIIPGTQYGCHPEFPGQQASEGILRLGRL
jgi:hypothetical protein